MSAAQAQEAQNLCYSIRSKKPSKDKQTKQLTTHQQQYATKTCLLLQLRNNRKKKMKNSEMKKNLLSNFLNLRRLLDFLAPVSLALFVFKNLS